MKQIQQSIQDEVGLHARPAALFCSMAAKFKSGVKIRNLTTGSRIVNAKSSLSVLTLGVEKNHTVEITAEGEDEEDAIIALQHLIESNFGEDMG